MVLERCNTLLDGNCDAEELDDDKKESILDEIVSTSIAKSSMKPLSIAYKDISVADFEALKEQFGHFETEDSRRDLESGLTLLATIGLEDQLRPGVKTAIGKLVQANTNVRIVSGDHKDSAMNVAIDVGLIVDKNATDDNIIKGSDLKDKLSDLMTLENGSWKFNSPASIKEFKHEILQVYIVVYRADPEVKLMFTSAIKEAGTIVGVTGEGLNDAEALAEANLGFAMGEDGCSAAKDKADIILTDDNFVSVVNAIRWGRNMQDNTRKFIQFQLTVNISCLTFVILSVVTLGFSPFSIFQLLWINLVMDILAAIAFATEHPHPEKLRPQRITKNDKIVTPLMQRAILSQAIYQFLVMIVLLYFGPAMFDIRYDFYPLPDTRVGDLPTRRLQHQTFLFQTFMMMNLFNMFNCRVLGQMPPSGKRANSDLDAESPEAVMARRELNIFQRLFSNWWFLIILLSEFNLQFLFVQYADLGVLFSSTPLTLGMHLTALFLGLGSLLVAVGVKFTPERYLKKAIQFGEDESTLRSYYKTIEDQSAFTNIQGE